MTDIRCKNCGKLLAKQKDREITIENKGIQGYETKSKLLEIKCPRCKELNEVVI